MAIECAYSFSDLYRAAFGREPLAEELVALYALPQNQRNARVKEWAAAAGWEIRVRVGNDGGLYAAFAPKF